MKKTFFYKKYFSNHFILSPDELRKINDHISNFLLSKKINLPIIYEIEKSSSERYELSSIEKVLADPNSKNGRISTILIRVGCEHLYSDEEMTAFYIESRFSKKEYFRCKLEIHDYRNPHDPRKDQQFSDNLCSIIESTQREHNFIPPILQKHLRGPLPKAIFYMICFFTLRNIPSLQDIKMSDISIIDFPVYLIFLAALFWLLSKTFNLLRLPTQIDHYLPVTGIFLWGAEIHDYERRKIIRDRFIFGFVGALLLGIFGDAIYDLALDYSNRFLQDKK